MYLYILIYIYLLSFLSQYFVRLILHYSEKQHQGERSAAITVTENIYSRYNYPAVYRFLSPDSLGWDGVVVAAICSPSSDSM